MAIPIGTKTFSSANILHVEAGTNGYHGGNSSHGSQTYLKLRDDGATCWRLKVRDGGGKEWRFDQPATIEIIAEGDTELETLTAALKFASQVLEELVDIERKIPEISLGVREV